jgi:hypothetical protein
MRVLVDSSVWIDHLRGVPTRETAMFGALLDSLNHEKDEAVPRSSWPISSFARCSVAYRIRASTPR